MTMLKMNKQPHAITISKGVLGIGLRRDVSMKFEIKRTDAAAVNLDSSEGE